MPSFALHTDMEIAGQLFKIVLAKIDAGVAFNGIWVNKSGTLCLSDLTDEFGVGLPEFLSAWSLDLTEVHLTYITQSANLSLGVALKTGENLDFSRKVVAQDTHYSFSFRYGGSDGEKLNFKELPIIGNMFTEDDYLSVKSLLVDYSTQTKKPQIKFVGKLQVVSFSHDIDTVLVSQQDNQPAKTSNDSSEDSSKDSSDDGVKWIDINKNFKMLRFSRLGFAFSGKMITVYFDAGFTIALLSIDFYGLYIGVSLNGGTFDFGLKGLMVSLNKPPIRLTGGLYKDSTADGTMQYSGMLQLKISDFTFTALGSYGELKKKDGGTTSSFFVYLLLEKPLGGPPCFFITGLALGMGVNREIVMPRLDQVPQFPLVQAAMGGGGLKPNDTVTVAINKLSNWIRPAEGAYFAAIGVKFTSFAIVTSFALLIAEFGSRTRISLLGQSILTVPPNQTRASNPFMYAELVLRAVFDFDEGYFEVLASLSKNSYILDHNCKLQGGFAFCAWSKGDRKGDFMISLGGCHHPLFKAKNRYPVVDKVGINWQISPQLSFKALAYMAVTHSCVMAGCNLSIDYRAGELHAWLYADASFYMQWKPFFYDINVSISVGISYRLKLLFVTLDIKLELSASLHLQGSEFSGSLTVKIWFISFTVNFGAKGSKPKALTWSEFSDSFLPRANGVPSCYALTQSKEGAEAVSIKISEGLIKEGKNKSGNNSLFVSSQELCILTHSAVPCTEFSLNERKMQITGLPTPGIAPMQLGAFKASHQVSIIRNDDNKLVDSSVFHVESIQDNLSAAVWGTKQLDLNADLVRGLGVGLKITTVEPKIIEILPKNADSLKPSTWYKLSNLEDKTEKTFAITPQALIKMTATWFETFAPQETKKEKERLMQLSKAFGTMTKTTYKEIRNTPKNYYWADFYSCKTGSIVTNVKEESEVQ